MELHIAIRVTDPYDHKHLSATIRLANQRENTILLLESKLSEADAVIMRRGEAGSALLLRACETTTRPIPIIYATSEYERNPWALRWPARTTDLISLSEAIYRHLKFSRDPLPHDECHDPNHACPVQQPQAPLTRRPAP